MALWTAIISNELMCRMASSSDHCPAAVWSLRCAPHPCRDASTNRWCVARNGFKEIPPKTFDGRCHQRRLGISSSGRESKSRGSARGMCWLTNICNRRRRSRPRDVKSCADVRRPNMLCHSRKDRRLVNALEIEDWIFSHRSSGTWARPRSVRSRAPMYCRSWVGVRCDLSWLTIHPSVWRNSNTYSTCAGRPASLWQIIRQSSR
jgi:hypothetical protein